MGLFKPSWKSSDPLKRRDAVKALKDQEKLKKVAAQDPEGYVRYAALERITDEKFLAAYAYQIDNSGLRTHAIKQIHSQQVLVALAALLTQDGTACITCFENLPGQLTRETLDELYPAGGWAALLAAERMKDEPELKKLKGMDPDDMVRHRAERALKDMEKERQMNSDDPSELRCSLLESKDEELVLNAAEKLRDDKLILQRLEAETSENPPGRDNNWRIGKKLVEKISDPECLRQLLSGQNKKLTRMVAEPALKKLMEVDPDFVSSIAKDEQTGSSLRCEAVSQLTDPALLTEIGLKYPGVRFYCLLNKHFDGNPRLLETVLADPASSEHDVELALRHNPRPECILKRLETEKNPKVIGMLCSHIPELEPYARAIQTVLKGGPVATVDYGTRKLTPVVQENFRRDAEAQLGVWTASAERLVAFAKTRPAALRPLWDRLAAAITGSVAEIHYHRFLETGSSEWDSGAQDFKYYADEKSWSETRPTGLVFPSLE